MNKKLLFIPISIGVISLCLSVFYSTPKLSTMGLSEEVWTSNCDSASDGPPEALRNPGVRFFRGQDVDVYWYSAKLAFEMGCKHSAETFKALKAFMEMPTLKRGERFDQLITPFYENLDSSTLFVKQLSVQDESEKTQVRAFIGHMGYAGELHPGRIYLFIIGRRNDEYTFLSKELPDNGNVVDLNFIGTCLGAKGNVSQLQDIWSKMLGPQVGTIQKYEQVLQCYLPLIAEDLAINNEANREVKELIPTVRFISKMAGY